MADLPSVIPKKAWFFIFNIGTNIYLIVTGTLHWNLISICSSGAALLLIDGIAWISSSKYKGRYKGW